MAEVAATFAKLLGLQRAVAAVLTENQDQARGYRYPNRHPNDVERYFHAASSGLQVLREALPDLYRDFHELTVGGDTKMGNGAADQPASYYYSHSQILKLARDITQILEIRASSELEQPKTNNSPRCAFITHGNTDEWRKVQPFIERDIGLKTIELAQEANAGQTIIEKLFANADRCDCAVIVWTGDDKDDKGVARARENVMHEIGFFQGKYGRGRVILLHEDGVNVPTNLSGVVYSPFSKGGVEASLHLLGRELKHIYGVK